MPVFDKMTQSAHLRPFSIIKVMHEMLSGGSDTLASVNTSHYHNIVRCQHYI